jgi:hypothetical protein
MASRVSFSGRHLRPSAIAEHHRDLEASLHLYCSDMSPRFCARFLDYLRTEVLDELGERLEETGLSSSLAILASIEAAFRIDYLQRCYRKDKQPISRYFRKVYQEKGQSASLDQDIFAAWATHHADERFLIAELRGAFRFRHWLAHGRYWTPKFGRRFNYDDVYTLAEEALSSFPFFDAVKTF